MVTNAAEACAHLKDAQITSTVILGWMQHVLGDDDDGVPLIAISEFARPGHNQDAVLISGDTLTDSLQELRNLAPGNDHLTIIMLGKGYRLEQPEDLPSATPTPVIVVFHLQRQGDVTNALMWDDGTVEFPDTPQMTTENLAALYTVFS